MDKETILKDIDNAAEGASEYSIEQDIANLLKGDGQAEQPEVAEQKEQPEVAEQSEQTEQTQPEQTEQPVDNTSRQRRQRVEQERLLDTFLKEDANGNLLNNFGEVIATAGKSREYYEGLKNEARKQRKAATDLAAQNMELAGRVKQIYDEYKGMSKGNSTPVQTIAQMTGLSEAQAANALGVIQAYQANPLDGIKKMLMQAKLDGVDLQSIGPNISVDPAVMQQTMQSMLDERLAPLTERINQEKAQQAAEEEVNRFLNEFPDAREYLDIIAQAKMQFPEMSPTEIWLRVSRELQKRPQERPQERPKPPPQQSIVKQVATNKAIEDLDWDELVPAVAQKINWK